MFQVRIHGRGGQGVVTAAELLSVAAFDEGRHAQAFPTFGSERTGAPVVAFCRIDDEPIRIREPVAEPDALIVQDPTLLHQVDLFSGLGGDAYVLINSSRDLDGLGLADLAGRFRPERLLTVPATALAREHLGRPLPNAVLLGGFAALRRASSRSARWRRRSATAFPARSARPTSPAPRPPTATSASRSAGSSMLEQIEGSQAVARTVAACRPEVISAYPISPQTHIVEALSDLVRTGELAPCEYLMVESEFAAMSACIGASAAGARAYTATASQGLLFMAEALYNASGLGLPIVMTLANRAIGAPINIWNDHSDSMSQRDSGWIQLYAETNQEAADLHVQAFRLAEELSLPVMVCMDGFILTHAYEQVDLPAQEAVDAFLPPFEPRQLLDPDEPVTIGAMVGPEAFTEVRYLMHAKQLQALDAIPVIAADFERAFGRDSGGLVRTYRTEDAETIVVALGSVLGTIEDVVDELRERGVKIGAVAIKCFRPYPLDEVREALQGRGADRRHREGVRGRRRRHRRPERAARPDRLRGPRQRRRRRARRPADHEAVAARPVRRRPRRAARARPAALPRPQA